LASRPIRFGPLPHLLCFSLLLLSAAHATADSGARVVAVHDGDTLTVLVSNRQVRVRLIEIDAPELGQPFGMRSKQSLAELCFGKQAHLDARSNDRYGRTLAHVMCAGRDANAEQVRRGYAWTYVRYAAPDSPLHALERDARAARRGLWGDPAPIAPWDWRRNGRHASFETTAPVYARWPGGSVSRAP
jgi:endonuclease YncB( thermonuclease family)